MRRALSWILLAMTVAGCASTNPSPKPAARPDEAERPDPVELPEPVATALILGGAHAHAGEPLLALPYFRIAHETLPSDVHIAIRYADTALEVGHPREALRALQRVNRVHPGEVEVNGRRVRIHLALGEIDQARALSAEMAEDHPGETNVLQLHAVVLEHGPQPEDAIEFYERLVAQQPGDAYSRLRLATLLGASGQLDRAQEHAEAAVLSDPEVPGAVEQLTRILEANQQPDRLADVLEAAIERHPHAVAPRTTLADVRLAEGDGEGAVNVLLPIAEGGELGWGPRLLLADLLLRLSRLDEAQTMVDGLLAEGHENGLLLRVAGDLAQERGELEAAEDLLRRAVKEDPEDLEAYVSLLLVMSQRSPEVFDPAEGSSERVRAFHRLLSRAHELANAPELRYDFLLGTLLRRSGRYGEAIGRLERAAEMGPEQEEILYDLAICQEELERYKEARVTLESLLELRPDEANYLNFYGYLLAEQGWDLDLAEELILRALQSEPENPFYLDSLGWVYYQTKRFELAHETLLLALDELGEDPTVLEHTGDTLRQLGDFESAADHYRRAMENGGEVERLQPRLDDAERFMVESP